MTEIYDDEEWKAIDGYPEYQVSNYGRILSTKYRYSKFTKPKTRVKLYGTNNTRVLISRLVLQYFRPVENLRDYNVFHIDGDDKNNHISNLGCKLRKNPEKPVVDIPDLEGEEWKVIEGFPEYQVSNLGRVKSFKNKKVKLLSSSSGDKYKYSRVQTTIKGEKGCLWYTHRLVASHFISNNDPELTSVSHINLDRSDNKASNLKYVLPTDPEDWKMAHCYMKIK